MSSTAGDYWQFGCARSWKTWRTLRKTISRVKGASTKTTSFGRIPDYAIPFSRFSEELVCAHEASSERGCIPSSISLKGLSRPA